MSRIPLPIDDRLRGTYDGAPTQRASSWRSSCRFWIARNAHDRDANEDYYEAVASARQLADSYVAKAPTAYPSGEPFPAQQLMYGLADNAAWLMAAGHPERDWKAQVLLIAMLSEADADPEGVDLQEHISTLGVMMDVHQALASAGRADQAAAMQHARLSLQRFWDESGFTAALASRTVNEGNASAPDVQ
jgi:hypothetical protein